LARNIRLYPWYQFFRSLLFWQALWFLYFQEQLSAAEAILLAAIIDVATTVLEVPSGYLSDRVGRRVTLLIGMAGAIAGALLLWVGDGFATFVVAQVLLGVSMAFNSGTDSALLYESLAREGRADEVDEQELRAWRFNFTGLALSAITGGIVASWSPATVFLLSAVASVAAFAIVFAFREPEHIETEVTFSSGRQVAEIRAALMQPALAWLFVLAVAMYVFSHVPFVFGQPFILEALGASGVSAEAAIVSGVISAAMMLISVAATWLAPGLRDRLGLHNLFLLALGIQVFLIAMLALSNHPLVIAFLVIRMVPNAFARAFILARIQPLVSDISRATYLSLQSFTGRLLFAGSLMAASGGASQGALGYAENRVILVGYLVAGLVVLAGLAVTARRVRFAT
jgi:predicted MFS family arabinose efflux permease